VQAKLANRDEEAFTSSRFVVVISMEKRIVTQSGEVWLGDDGLIRIEIRNPREHTLQDATVDWTQLDARPHSPVGSERAGLRSIRSLGRSSLRPAPRASQPHL